MAEVPSDYILKRTDAHVLSAVILYWPFFCGIGSRIDPLRFDHVPNISCQASRCILLYLQFQVSQPPLAILQSLTSLRKVTIIYLYPRTIRPQFRGLLGSLIGPYLENFSRFRIGIRLSGISIRYTSRFWRSVRI